MEKTFVYNVNGTTFEDSVAFGAAWAAAKEQATIEHTYITRQVIRGDKIKNEFFAKCGAFLNERFMDDTAVCIF